MPRKWRFQPFDPVATDRLSKQLGVSPLLAQVMMARGQDNVEAATEFLNPRLSGLIPPNELPGVPEASLRIVAAVRSGRRVTVYGDYDVDGVTATSVLWYCLKLAGAQVDYHIPCRQADGYGLNCDAIRTLHEEDPDRLLISVDCGIASVTEAALAKELGLELIITDHHHFGDELPDAAVLVHPRLPGTDYPFGDLCGVGVAFKLAWAICLVLGDGEHATPQMREFLKSAVGLTAMGTIADVVPLLSENRAIVKYGLHSLKEMAAPGIKALLAVCELNDKPALKADDIAFSVAPRINAAGRLGQARLAVELLTTQKPDRAIELASYLNQLNKNRQTVERRIFRQAKELVAEHPEWEHHTTLVLAHHEWHSGVIGIVASRMAEEFEKPTVMIALRDDGTGQGSGRSWAGFDLHAGLTACRESLLTFGGHQAAAGVRVAHEKIDEFRDAFSNWAARNHAPTDEDLELQIDAEVRLNDVTRRAVLELDRLGPFGEGNPQPRFAATGVQLTEPPRTMGEGDRHLSIRVRQGNTTLRAVAFGRGEWAGEMAAANAPISISFAPIINSWNGRENVELRLIDWRPAGT